MDLLGKPTILRVHPHLVIRFRSDDSVVYGRPGLRNEGFRALWVVWGSPGDWEAVWNHKSPAATQIPIATIFSP